MYLAQEKTTTAYKFSVYMKAHRPVDNRESPELPCLLGV